MIYKHLNINQNKESGVCDIVLVAPISFFTSNGIKEPIPGDSPDSLVNITDDHVFKPGYGFIKLKGSPYKQGYSFNTTGQAASTINESSLSVFVPGSDAISHGMMMILANEPCIALVKDISQEAAIWYQNGSKKMPALLSFNFSTGTANSGQKGWQLTIKSYDNNCLIYQGALPLYDEELSNLNLYITDTEDAIYCTEDEELLTF